MEKIYFVKVRVNVFVNKYICVLGEGLFWNGGVGLFICLKYIMVFRLDIVIKRLIEYLFLL